MSTNIKKVVIAGGGTAGWIAAVALSTKLGNLIDIMLVESDEIGTVGVGEASIPPMRTFHKLMRIDEQDFMRATSATFKLGIGFENWGQKEDKYFHSFGKTGQPSWFCEFHHFWLYAQQKGIGGDFGDYCYELQAAKENRFATSPQGEINYAYHLDATRYARFLRGLSETNGVKRIEGKISSVEQHPDTGFIEALILDSGQKIEGDFFIDCTGFRGLLIEQTLSSGYEDWSHWLLCDSAIAVQTEAVRPPVPYTRCIAHDAGWQWQIPLQHRVGNGLVYSSRYLKDEAARELLLANVSGDTCSDPRLIKFRPGRRRKTWNKNCVALGLASGFLEPLESTSIHLVIMGVSRLMHLFPFNGVNDALVNEFNQQTQHEIEKIRDFIILHYHATERDDSPFWRLCRSMEVPETLAHRLQLFRETGHAFQGDGELFRVDSWTQVMLGQRVYPKHYHQLPQLMNDNSLNQFLKTIKGDIAKAVEKLPLHHDFIAQYCKAQM